MRRGYYLCSSWNKSSQQTLSPHSGLTEKAFIGDIISVTKENPQHNIKIEIGRLKENGRK